MSRVIVFDARFKNESGVGVTVDGDIRVDLFEEGNDKTPVEQRTLGPDPAVNVLASNDAEGVLYTTTLDASQFLKGDITAKWYAKNLGVQINPYPFVEVQPNVIDEALTSGEIKNYIRTMMGYPATAVELVSDHYTTIIEEALSFYGQWVPVERVTFVDLVIGQDAYTFPNMPQRGPFDVKFVRKEGTPLISDPLFGREYPRGQQLDFDQYVLGISFWETLNRVTNQEPEWHWDHNSKTLYINIGGTNVAGPSGNYFVMVRYFQSASLDKVRNDHFRWFKRYCLMHAKKILAEIRGKFSGQVPSPNGRFTMNSEQLLQDSEKMEAELVAEIRGMSPSIPPVHG